MGVTFEVLPTVEDRIKVVVSVPVGKGKVAVIHDVAVAVLRGDV
jgi:hypothetical protein